MEKTTNFKMKKIYKIILFLFLISFSNIGLADKNFFEEGKNLFDKKDYINAKFKFEKDIVFNPKSENSYLYLSKIFSAENKIDLAENNLNTVILLNPKNEEAIYDLTLLKLQKSNYNDAKKLIKTFKNVCKKNCARSKTLNEKLKNSLTQ
ncbi:MAG: hypothetical protein FD547_000138 [Pelagibacterales bacterium]|nr:hypothetical protein [Pelagibacterales bacterium]